MYVFFLINLLVSFLLFLYFYRKRFPDSFIRLIIMSFLPVGGLLLFITLDINKFYFPKCRTVLAEGGIPDMSHYTNLSSERANIEEDINMVPIQDALVLNDDKTKRALITKVLMDDPYVYLKVLIKALYNTDTETSHYAATAVAEIKRDLILTVNKLDMECKDSADNVDIKKSYAKILKKYLESDLLDSRVYTKYMNILLEVLSDIVKVDTSDEFFLEQKIRCEISFGKYDDALNSCKEYMGQFNKSDIPYMLLMKIYFITKDQINFQKVLKRIQGTNVKLQRQSLRMIRFWSEGV